ncbi:hypothetical protein [Caenispirillum bisanense]|uniref:hypothetical protein n=1 Tax=Caenispirillum bisanense TaxID=414052 RepID=UPI0031DD63F3
MTLRRHLADLTVALVLTGCVLAPVSYALAQQPPDAATLESLQARNIQSLNQLEAARAQEQIRLEAEYRDAGDAAFSRYAAALKQGVSPGVARQQYLDNLSAVEQQYQAALNDLDQRMARDRAALVAQEGQGR